MKKVLGLTIALLLTLTLSAAADQAIGKVKGIDRADQSFVLEDGTKFWVSESQLTQLTPGEQVQAVYETKDGKKVVTGLGHRTIGPDSHLTTIWSINDSPIDSIQSE